MRIWLCIMIYLFGSAALRAQNDIRGTVMDSVYSKAVEAGTITLYENGKQTIYKVTLTDRYGKFSIDDVIYDKPLTLELYMQGYQKSQLNLQLKQGEQLDLGIIYLAQQASEIDTVEIIPPIRMNRDTIEFNTDAFHLDSNAVVEDLLHKLPGLVVWGDGLITYNGREVPTVLVNGKPFFGSDKAISLQNIEKTAVKKIQIYDRRSEVEKEIDIENKQYEMNLVLKDGKEVMYFGHIGGGMGNRKRHQQHLNLNLANKRSQATVAYSGNNVNKDLASVDQLLKNTTFKGIGINADFDSDFLRQGILRQHVLGGRYQYDFLATGEVGQKDLLRADVTSRWNNNYNIHERVTQLLNADESFENTRSYTALRQDDWRVQNGRLNYERSLANQQIGKRFFSVSVDLFGQNSFNDHHAQESTQYNYIDDRSSNQINTYGIDRGSNVKFASRLGLSSKTGEGLHRNDSYSFVDRLRFGLSFDAEIGNQQGDHHKDGQFSSETNPSASRQYNRNYDDKSDRKDIQATFDLSDGRFTIRHRVRITNNEMDHQVVDLLAGEFISNIDLTHLSSYTQQEFEPSIGYTRELWDRKYYGRSQSRLLFDAIGGYRIVDYESKSTLGYRNISRNFKNPFTSGKLTYTYGKTGLYYLNSYFQYRYDEDFPLLDQQVRPIYDDIQPGIRYFGARHILRMRSSNRLSSYIHLNQVRQYGVNSSLAINYTVTHDALTDSIQFRDGQQQIYTAQIGMPTYHLGYEFNFSKPFFLAKDHTVVMKLKNTASILNNVQYIEAIEQPMINRDLAFDLSVYYTALTKVQVGLTNYVNLFGRKSGGEQLANNSYSSTVWNTGVSLAYSINTKLTISSNLTRRANYSSFQDISATIWNANMAYRFLKGNNLEAKVAIYDILNQNRGFYFINSPSEFSTGYRNILNQYVMFSLSYMPRKFGGSRD